MVNYTGGNAYGGYNLGGLEPGSTDPSLAQFSGYNQVGLEPGAVSPDLASLTTSSNGGGSSGSFDLGSVVGPGLAAGVGLYDLLQGNQPTPAEQGLAGNAAYEGRIGQQETTAGAGLQSYLEQGTLDPAHQAQLELAQQAAKARLVQGAATRGQNTNPLANSGLSQDLNSLGLQAEVAKAQEEQALFNSGEQLLQSGQQALGLQATDLATLAKIQEQQQQDTTNAIMGFAKALGSLPWAQIIPAVAAA